jgi:ABC-type Mn2+/Zn2+ transport system ATPase subunit
MTTPAIRLEKVSFALQRELVCASGVYSVLPLDFVVVVGPNVGGQTTMLKLRWVVRPQQAAPSGFSGNRRIGCAAASVTCPHHAAR